jgi:hypothetical protein
MLIEHLQQSCPTTVVRADSRHPHPFFRHNDHCMDGYGNGVAEPACLEFLRRAGGPECGPGRGGPTCGDRVATFILCE